MCTHTERHMCSQKHTGLLVFQVQTAVVWSENIWLMINSLEGGNVKRGEGERIKESFDILGEICILTFAESQMRRSISRCVCVLAMELEPRMCVGGILLPLEEAVSSAFVC